MKEGENKMNNIEDFVKDFISKENLVKNNSIEIFVNHMNEFKDRSKKNECIQMEVEKSMKDEIGLENYKLAELLVDSFLDKFNLNAKSDFEIFLVSTHLSLFKKG